MSNKRQSTRRRVHNFGKIIFSGGREIVACVIVDVSEDGALLVFDAGAAKSGAELPDKFILHNKKAGTFHEAKVARRAGRTVGVRLLSALDREDVDDARPAVSWG